MRIAALTMAYNEADFLPVWVRHYAAQLGAANCYVVDHGSTDGSTDGLPCSVIRLPRTPLDEERRARFVRDQVAALLHWYDAVLHSDVDEIVVADPARHAGLAALADDSGAEALTAIGLDLHHLPGEEPPLDTARPMLAQRGWVRFSAAMCKPVLVRRAVEWAPGFHSSDAPLRFGGLLLFHLRYADLGMGLRRLSRSRSTAVVDAATNPHQRVPDSEFADMMHRVATLPRRPASLDAAVPPLLRWIEAVEASRRTRETERYKLDLGLSGDELWQVPDRLRAVF